MAQASPASTQALLMDGSPLARQGHPISTRIAHSYAQTLRVIGPEKVAARSPDVSQVFYTVRFRPCRGLRATAAFFATRARVEDGGTAIGHWANQGS